MKVSMLLWLYHCAFVDIKLMYTCTHTHTIVGLLISNSWGFSLRSYTVRSTSCWRSISTGCCCCFFCSWAVSGAYCKSLIAGDSIPASSGSVVYRSSSCIWPWPPTEDVVLRRPLCSNSNKSRSYTAHKHEQLVSQHALLILTRGHCDLNVWPLNPNIQLSQMQLNIQ